MKYWTLTHYRILKDAHRMKTEPVFNYGTNTPKVHAMSIPVVKT